MENSTYENIKMLDNLPIRILDISLDSKELRDLNFNINEVLYIPRHWHRSLEITFIKKGKLRLNIMDESLVFNKGETLLVNSGYLHEVSNIKGIEGAVLGLQISYDFLKDNIPNYDQVTFKLKNDERSNKFFEQHFTDINDLAIENTLVSNIKAKALLYELVAELVENHISDHNNPSERDNTFIIEVIDWIHEHYSNPLSLDEISFEFQMSKEHFSRLFKKSMGETFLQYLNNYRIYRSYPDLLHSTLTIEEVSRKHGFSNVKSLITNFKDKHGITPGVFRKNRNVTILNHTDTQNS